MCSRNYSCDYRMNGRNYVMVLWYMTYISPKIYAWNVGKNSCSFHLTPLTNKKKTCESLPKTKYTSEDRCYAIDIICVNKVVVVYLLVIIHRKNVASLVGLCGCSIELRVNLKKFERFPRNFSVLGDSFNRWMIMSRKWSDSLNGLQIKQKFFCFTLVGEHAPFKGAGGKFCFGFRFFQFFLISMNTWDIEIDNY